MVSGHSAHIPRPRRSMLYVPGSHQRALEKAAQLPADALIFDLEDAVLPDAKPEARAQIIEALQTHPYGRREKVVRVNALESVWGKDDIEALARAPGVDVLLLPKVEDPAEISAAEAALDRAGAPKHLGLMAMIETPLGVLKVADIAKSSSRLAGLVMGTNDLEEQTGAQQTPDRTPMLMALSTCVMAARAYGLAIIDGVFAQLKEAEGLACACKQGAELGFDGKTVIHPSQIEAANAAFGPSAQAVERAKAVVEAYRQAKASGRGVTLLDGQLIESLHVRMAERVITLDQAIMSLKMEAE